jgi:hypothetical protein
MKNRLLFLSLGLVLMSVSGARAADAQPATASAPATNPADKPDTELEKAMGKMNKPWRTVRQQARDGKLTPATADLVATMIVNAEAAEKMTPELEADQPVANRAKFQADYEAAIKKLVDTLGQLETALKANDTATATKLVAAIGDLRKSGHKDFRKPDDKH